MIDDIDRQIDEERERRETEIRQDQRVESELEAIREGLDDADAAPSFDLASL